MAAWHLGLAIPSGMGKRASGSGVDALSVLMLSAIAAGGSVPSGVAAYRLAWSRLRRAVNLLR